jgi:KaiC/GvpD/RAD55 family RecA-like ATPase
MANKIPTGVKKLDELLDGGLMAGSIILVIGEPGTGKTTLLRDFLYQGVSEGEECIYFLTNRSLDHVLVNMNKFGWDVGDHENLRFILYDGVVSKRVKSLVGNFEDLIDVTYNCEKLIATFKPGRARMILDELSYLFLMNNKDVVFKFLHRISQILRQSNITCFIEVQKGMLDPQIVTSLESMTEGTIEMRREGDRRSLKISRLEQEQVKPSWIDFDISIGVGIEMEAVRTLDEWEKKLLEMDEHDDERKVKSFLKDIREGRERGSKKGLFSR